MKSIVVGSHVIWTSPSGKKHGGVIEDIRNNRTEGKLVYDEEGDPAFDWVKLDECKYTHPYRIL